MHSNLPLICIVVVSLTGNALCQVHSDANVPPEPGDIIGNEISQLLFNVEQASNRFRDMKAEEISKFCAYGIRVTHKPAFTNPRSFVILFDIKRIKGEELISLAWVEYFATDYTTLSLHRTVKAIPIQDQEQAKKIILSTPLWNQPDQRDISGFKTGYLDGDNYTIDLINGSKTKTLNYHVPDSYNDEHNNKFRDDLFHLLQSLDQAGAPFHLYSPEWRKRQQAREEK